VKDAIGVTDMLAAEHPDTPLFLFGHSMGSFVAQTLLTGQASYAGVVLAGSNGRALATHSALLALALVERGLRGPRRQSRWANALLRTACNRQFRPTRTAADWLSRDEREVDAALADPLCGVGLTTQSWIDYARGLLTLDMPGRFRHVGAALPVLIVAGTNDPVGENGRGPTRLARAMKKNEALDVTLRLYPLARHELVNETNRDEVTRDVIQWLDAHRDVVTVRSRDVDA
jgi:alpha-beta hydrolase superfamily lysophospholipase